MESRDVQAASEAIRHLVPVAHRVAAERMRHRRERVEAVAGVARSVLFSRAAVYRARLEAWLEQYRRVGDIPPLFKLMGQSDLEKPFNRLLAWLLDKDSPHQIARPMLRAIAVHLEFDRLVRDIDERFDEVEVYGEKTFPSCAKSDRQPDLLILSPSCVLLLENKVLSPESGSGQYQEYHDAAHLLAQESSRPETKLYLLARSLRKQPDNWNGFRSHGDFVGVILEVVESHQLAWWDRVMLLLAARQLANHEPLDVFASRAEELLGSGGLGPGDEHKALALMELASRTPEIPMTPLGGGT